MNKFLHMLPKIKGFTELNLEKHLSNHEHRRENNLNLKTDHQKQTTTKNVTFPSGLL